MRLAICVAVAFALASCARGAGEAMQITDNGNPVAMIVVPDAATATEQFAAEELRSYLAQISGAELPIEAEAQAPEGARLLVGATSAGQQARQALAEGDPDAFTVRTVGNDPLLVGATDRGTLYAVYDFLEDDLGCRWLGPGPDWEDIPSQPSITIGDLDRTESPAMKYRFLRMTVVGEPETWKDYCMSWAVKQKINIGSGWPQTELPEQISKRGGFRAWMSPHVIKSILDVDEHFDEHPEWYALRGGARKNTGRNTQLCTTNPEVVEAVAAGLGEMFDARPEVDFMGLGQADGTAFCECESCLALDTGDIWPYRDKGLPVITERWLSFVNAVARRLQETHPGKGIYTLAYHQTFRPPDRDVTKPEPNVMIQVVNSRPNYVCFVHRFEREDCPHHVKFREGLERWVELTPAGVMVYEYDPHSTFCTMPYPAARKFVDDINYLCRLGVVGYEGQSGPTVWGTYGINHYAIAKTTWSGEMDGDALVSDYCDHAFGPASGAVQRFIATIEAGLEAADHITEGVWTYMTPEVMAAGRKQLDAAHAAAEGADEQVRRRLRAWEISFHYGEMGIEAWRKAQKALADEDADLLEDAINLAEAAGQYCLDEQEKEPHYAAFPGKLTKVYANSWKRTLARWRE